MGKIGTTDAWERSPSKPVFSGNLKSLWQTRYHQRRNLNTLTNIQWTIKRWMISTSTVLRVWTLFRQIVAIIVILFSYNVIFSVLI